MDKSDWKARIRQLRDLLNEWDPIGCDGPPDEYDCLIGPLLGRLSAGDGQSQISELLRLELQDHFGLDPAGLGVDAMASRLAGWWAAAERR